MFLGLEEFPLMSKQSTGDICFLSDLCTQKQDMLAARKQWRLTMQYSWRRHSLILSVSPCPKVGGLSFDSGE